jgi:hypothetical protein
MVGFRHTVPDLNVVEFAFEDITGDASDRDYDDVVFTVTPTNAIVIP